MNSVKDARMRTVDSGLTSWRAVSSSDIEEQSRIWADFMDSLDAMFKPVMLRRTFASPIMEKSRLTDILKSLLKSLKCLRSLKER